MVIILSFRAGSLYCPVCLVSKVALIISVKSKHSNFTSCPWAQEKNLIKSMGEELLIDPHLIIFIHCFPFQNVGYSCMQCCTDSFDASLRWPKLPFKKNSTCWSIALMTRKTFLQFYSEFLDPIMTEPQIWQIAPALVWPVIALSSKSSAILLLFIIIQLQPFFTSVFSTMSQRNSLPPHTFSTHNQCIYHIQYMFCK